MYTVIIKLPKNREFLEKKYAEVLADIVSQELSEKELEYVINHLEKGTS